MTTYQYSPLKTEDDEIRLITLMPGAFGDDISFNMFHAPLPSSRPDTKTASQRLDIEEIRKTLPVGWRVRETVDGRYLFSSSDDKPTSWQHPDAIIDRALYGLFNDEPISADRLSYEALSYVWGSAEHAVQAIVTDHSQDDECSTVVIRTDLALALRYLRYHDRSRTLWIDAICIDQDNSEERSAQVSRMGSIYTLATRVIVWLGPEANESTHALSTLEYLGNQVEYTTDDFLAKSPGAQEPMWYMIEQSLP